MAESTTEYIAPRQEDLRIHTIQVPFDISAHVTREAGGAGDDETMSSQDYPRVHAFIAACQKRMYGVRGGQLWSITKAEPVRREGGKVICEVRCGGIEEDRDRLQGAIQKMMGEEWEASGQRKYP